MTRSVGAAKRITLTGFDHIFDTYHRLAHISFTKKSQWTLSGLTNDLHSLYFLKHILTPWMDHCRACDVKTGARNKGKTNSKLEAVMCHN